MYRASQAAKKRKVIKKQAILSAASSVFSEKGYHDTAVKDIVERAEISVGSFYFYFAGKEELFKELYQSIVNEFSDITMGVTDTERFSMLKNYTRVMTATLWMYAQKREIARIMLIQATVPGFRELEDSRMRDFAGTMAGWFERFRSHAEVNIPDAQIAALIYAGSYYCLTKELISSDPPASLSEYCFSFCVYNLQALRIPFEEAAVRTYISEVLTELEA